jgi:hypothetical protein
MRRAALLWTLFLVSANWAAADEQLSIQPYPGNPWYWQFRGQPQVLIGGSREDNLFQIPDLKEHLDLLAGAGGNYIRNTMSSRDEGDLWPVVLLTDGKYDLEQLNVEYFRRFENLLRLALERGIIVQIEVWDRFDFAREPWLLNPYRPANNVNYSTEESGLADEYPEHPGRNHNPFFRSVPDHNRLLLKYQQAQVDRLLAISLKYPNVLYCIDNETSGTPAWGRFWAEYIQKRGAEAGIRVPTTEMWDAWDLKDEQHRATFDHPELYSFIDISQNNHNRDQQHWDNLQWVRGYVASRPRPLNHVKIYGADTGRYGSDRDGIERFWRSLLGGAASIRFHRPESGLGLNQKAQACLRSARLFLGEYDLIRAEPDAGSSLLSERGPDEAYLSKIPGGREFALYFPEGGSVALDLRQLTGSFSVTWLDIMNSRWQRAPASQGGGTVRLTAPTADHWIVILKAQD